MLGLAFLGKVKVMQPELTLRKHRRYAYMMLYLPQVLFSIVCFFIIDQVVPALVPGWKINLIDNGWFYFFLALVVFGGIKVTGGALILLGNLANKFGNKAG